MARATSRRLTPADRHYGYQFGCDGLMTVPEALAQLGISRWTLNRRIAAGQIRKGKDGGRVVLCRRSVAEFIASLEV